MTFINGFSYWHDGFRKLKKHDDSRCHFEAVSRVNNSSDNNNDSDTNNVSEPFNSQVKLSKEDGHDVITFVIDAIRHLARQGLELGDATAEVSNPDVFEPDSNLWQLLCTWSRLSPRLGELLKHARMYVSPEIQNELLSIMGSSVQREVVGMINSFPWYSLMLDEVVDTSGQEQLVISFRYVNYVLTSQLSPNFMLHSFYSYSFNITVRSYYL